MSRHLLVVVCAIILCGQSRAKEAALGAGQVKMELELLRAPALEVAKLILDGTGDAALRKKVLAAGAKTVLRCALTGAPDEELRDEKLVETQEPKVWEYAQLREAQGYAAKKGEVQPDLEKDCDSESHVEGHVLTATLEPVKSGVLARIGFRWAGTPVIRPITSWPVKGRTARLVQDRTWEFSLRRRLTIDAPRLLAIEPEPPLADGLPTGFVFLAFGKVASATAPADLPDETTPRSVQCWTLDVPHAAAQPWLSQRTGPRGDEAQFQKLLRDIRRPGGATLLGLQVLCENLYANSREQSSVDSRLAWSESRGYEPSDTRWVSFVPNPNDSHSSAVAQRLELQDDIAALTLPIGGVQWTRWHGSTRGAVDEPAGVENSATGSMESPFFNGRTPGRVFLVRASTLGPVTRLTFTRIIAPPRERRHAHETMFSVVETPVEPWLPRLVKGGDLAKLLPELTAAGDAVIVQREVMIFAAGQRAKVQSQWPWQSFAEDYLNPSIHDGKLCFNPRFVSDSSPGCSIELDQWACSATFRGPPVSRHFGFWLDGVAGFDAATSSIALSEWPHLEISSEALLPPGQEVILAASLGRSWSDPGKTVLHWVLARRLEIPGSGRAKSDALLPPVPVTSFTITGANGTVEEHVTLRGSQFRNGREVQSPLLREGQLFQDSADLPHAGKKMLSQPGFGRMLDGMFLEVRDGQWSLTRSRAPARKITEHLLSFTEQPLADGGYEMKDIPVGCERLVIEQEKFTGRLPSPGASVEEWLDGDRTLTVRVQ
jgi:hypothetical protein